MGERDNPRHLRTRTSPDQRRPRRRVGTPVLTELLESRRLLSASLVISEFMASNSKTLKDQAGDYSDWIEVHNAGDADANLNDYFLTDNAGDPEKWRFPVQALPAGGYLVVFADSSNAPPVAGQELHTNFNLGADGEYLGLMRAADDSAQFEYAPQFPAQTKDVSYGLSDSNDPNSARVFFSVPSPGAANTPSVAVPTFSVAGQVFAGTLTVSLSDATPGAVIHYTTNGSTPTASSPTYAGPITLTQSTPIRVIATASGMTSSPVTTQTYERVDSTVTSVQNSNLPIVIIDTYGATMNDTTGVAASATFVNAVNGSTNVMGPADYQGRIGIHIRGSTSENYAKQQYAIELWDENNNDKKASLFGMPAESDWVLYDPYTELSLMQNPLAYEWANETGHYASRTQFVEVYMSTGGNQYAGNTTTINYASNYMGVYILQEKVKIDDNRVDVDQMSASNPNGGFIVAQDRYTGTVYFTTPQGVHMVLDDPDDGAYVSATSAQWDAFENALFNGSTAPGQPWNTPGNASYYGNYIDVGSWVDYYLLEEMTRNVDAFWLSTFYTKAADTVVNGAVTQRGLISAGPVWDFNLALGAPNYNGAANSAGWDTTTLSPYPGAAGVSGFNPQDAYFQRLLADPNFVQAVSDRWNELRQGVFSTSKLISDIDANVALLSANTGVYPVGTNPTGTTSPVMRNFQKWKELGVFVTTDGMYDPAGSWIQDVNLMKNWLTARVDWMDTQFTPAPAVTPGGDYGGATPITMTPMGPAVATDTVLLGESAAAVALIPSSTNNPSGWQLPSYTPGSGWTSGTTGVGYDRSTTGTGAVDYTPYIGLNVGGMYNTSTSVYIRISFTLTQAQLNNLQHLILKMRYDDGFIAWVNGVRVMDVNSGENTVPSRTTKATTDARPDAAALSYEDFDISSVKSMLVVGTNVLAIQGLNGAIGSSDMLILPELISRAYSYPQVGTVYYTTDGSDPRTTTGAVSASALTYNGAFSLATDTEIKARTYANGVWSALSDQVYVFDSTALRITELMFNPPAPPAGSAFTAQDFEYVEVQNTSASPLNLGGYAFSNGVTFTFPNVTLAPGAYGVIVKNPAAFASRYGNSPNVLGTYSGSFDNSGEKVELDNGFGQALETFKYQPTWYPSTNGGGYSLVVADPAGDPAALGGADGWRASFTPDGAPGYADADTTAPALVSWSASDGGATGSPTITFTFNTPVSAGSLANLTVTDAITGQSIPVASHWVDGDSILFALAAPLPSGAYRFTLPAGAIANASNITTTAATVATALLVRVGQTWALPASPNLVVQQLAIGTGGTLDLGTGALLLDYKGPSPAGAVRQLLASGRAGGSWTGTGITSSAAASTPNRAIAYAEASDLGLTTFAGQTVDGTALLLKYTYAGDANLDGVINPDDFALADRGVAKGLNSWVFGDFDYDGQVTAADLTLLDRSASGAGAPAPMTSIAPVPSPVSAPAPATAAPTEVVTSASVPPVALAGDAAAPPAIPAVPATATATTTTKTTTKAVPPKGQSKAKPKAVAKPSTAGKATKAVPPKVQAKAKPKAAAKAPTKGKALKAASPKGQAAVKPKVVSKPSATGKATKAAASKGHTDAGRKPAAKPVSASHRPAPIPSIFSALPIQAIDHGYRG